MYFEEVERVALKDAQPILRWTVELVLSGLLGDALWSYVLACCTWVSARAKYLLLSNDQPYFICCWYRCHIYLFPSALGPTGTTVAEMLCLKGHKTNSIARLKHCILSKAKAV